MRGVILKESEILKSALEGDVGKKPLETLRIMTKKYLSEGKSKDEIFEELNEYMEDNYIGYKASKWNNLLLQMIKSVSKYNNYDIIDVDGIVITENEWNSIIALNNKQLEKLAFILLVYQKINIIKNPESNGWINQNYTDIFKEASVGSKLSGNDQRKLLNQLYKLDYISQKHSCDATSLKINYIDIESDIKIVVDNFINVITYYDEYRNGVKYIKCEVCNKRVEQKTNNQKYCNRCSKSIDNINRNTRKRGMSDSERFIKASNINGLRAF